MGAVMKRGELVSQDIVMEILRDGITASNDYNGFLIDGFPRDIPQGVRFEEEIGKCKSLLYFQCSNECMTERLLGRGRSSGRADDNAESIKLRIKTFERQTMPVVDKFKERVKVIDAERDVDDIFGEVCQYLDTLT